jgi:hypothetical protein
MATHAHYLTHTDTKSNAHATRRGIAHAPTTASSSVEQPLRTHDTCTTVLQSLSALTLQRCDTATATCTITGHECVARTASYRHSHQQTQVQRNTTLPPQRVHAAQQDAHKRAINNKIPRSTTQSHSSHSETRCSNAHATTQSRNRDTAVQRRLHAQDARSTSRV